MGYPYLWFLRACSTDGQSSSGAEAGSASDAPKPASMGRKNDFIVWLRLKPMQRKVYEVSQAADML